MGGRVSEKTFASHSFETLASLTKNVTVIVQIFPEASLICREAGDDPTSPPAPSIQLAHRAEWSSGMRKPRSLTLPAQIWIWLTLRTQNTPFKLCLGLTLSNSHLPAPNGQNKSVDALAHGEIPSPPRFQGLSKPFILVRCRYFSTFAGIDDSLGQTVVWVCDKGAGLGLSSGNPKDASRWVGVGRVSVCSRACAAAAASSGWSAWLGGLPFLCSMTGSGECFAAERPLQTAWQSIRNRTTPT